MSDYELVILSVGLAMDASAVAFFCGACNPKAKARSVIKTAIIFGFFQGFMPVIGYFVGVVMSEIIQNFDHWVAFILLFLVGGKMIFGARKSEKVASTYSNKELVILAIATSIDALVVGVSFSFLNIGLLKGFFVIGTITLFLSLIAGFLGRRIAFIKPMYLKMFGGLAIIGIGLKILVTHLM